MGRDRRVPSVEDAAWDSCRLVWTCQICALAKGHARLRPLYTPHSDQRWRKVHVSACLAMNFPERTCFSTPDFRAFLRVFVPVLQEACTDEIEKVSTQYW